MGVRKMYMNNNNKKLLAFVVALVFLLYVLNIREIGIFSYFRDRRKTYTTQLYVINTTGCRIPYLDTYNEEVMKLMGTVGAYNCGKPPLVTSNLTALTVNSSVFRQYGIYNYKEVNCSYTPFWRVDPTGKDPDHKVKFGEKKYFQSSIKVDEEFVKVECKYKRNKYKDYHSFVPTRQTKVNSKRAINDQKLNVIILGTDSLSRLHFHRTMPRTAKFLLEDLNGIEFLGYNKLADNTFPNLIPLLTGYSFEEIKKVCWPNYDTHFDNCSFVFQNYSNSGFVTSFAEEWTLYGLFNYLKKGWYEQPTDYYWKTFDYKAMGDLQHDYDYFHTYPKCMSSRPMYKVLFNHHKKFINRMIENNNRFFSFLWITSLTHDNYNTPVVAESDYIEHLSFLIDSGVLNNTVLLFLSDHGYRFGKMPTTHQGHLEERLPLIYFVVPPWFSERYPVGYDNLKENSHRLTTPFDVHATLNHLLNIEQFTDEELSKSDPNKRDISLFLPVPLNRTCDSTNIPSHWCTCHESVPVDKTNPIVLKVAEYAIGYMNYLLTNYDNCSLLQLDTITDAKLAKYGRASETATSDYSVSFQVSPGGGWFDTTVRCTKCDDHDDFKISGSISRLNRYDNTSYCINDFNLKLYCYCKEQLRV